MNLGKIGCNLRDVSESERKREREMEAKREGEREAEVDEGSDRWK